MHSESSFGNARVLAAGNTRSQRGSAKVRALAWTLVILAFVFVAWKVIPPYFANYELEDWLNGNILAFMGKNIPNDDLTAAVLKEMATEGIEGTKDNVKILQNNSRGLNVEVDYNVTVDLAAFQMNLHFTPHTNSQQLVQ
jgi:hypothetical protein